MIREKVEHVMVAVKKPLTPAEELAAARQELAEQEKGWHQYRTDWRQAAVHFRNHPFNYQPPARDGDKVLSEWKEKIYKLREQVAALEEKDPATIAAKQAKEAETQRLAWQARQRAEIEEVAVRIEQIKL